MLAEEYQGIRPCRGGEDAKALSGQRRLDEFTGWLVTVHHQDRPAARWTGLLSQGVLC